MCACERVGVLLSGSRHDIAIRTLLTNAEKHKGISKRCGTLAKPHNYQWPHRSLARRPKRLLDSRSLDEIICTIALPSIPRKIRPAQRRSLQAEEWSNIPTSSHHGRMEDQSIFPKRARIWSAGRSWRSCITPVSCG